MRCNPDAPSELRSVMVYFEESGQNEKYEFVKRSSASSKSEYVKKEIAHALKVKKGEDKNPPEIMPVIIEHPPPKPPEELNHLHFNDETRYLVKYI